MQVTGLCIDDYIHAYIYYEIFRFFNGPFILKERKTVLQTLIRKKADERLLRAVLGKVYVQRQRCLAFLRPAKCRPFVFIDAERGSAAIVCRTDRAMIYAPAYLYE